MLHGWVRMTIIQPGVQGMLLSMSDVDGGVGQELGKGVVGRLE